MGAATARYHAATVGSINQPAVCTAAQVVILGLVLLDYTHAMLAIGGIMMLEIKNLHASINGKEILKGINLSVKEGEVHAIMGPNGSGKSTLSSVLVGNPAFTVTEGEVTFNGKNLLELSAEDRSREGLFLSFQ